MGSTERTVVVVSGGDAVSPFTTPTLACRRGMAAGNTDTALREALLAAGRVVFTAPAMNARTVVQDPDPDSFGSFGEQPVVLPAHMTMISNGDIDNAGEHLARFAQHLYQEYDVRRIDWVTHSNGGLFARSATRILGEIGHPLQVTSLTTLGAPWMGGVPNRIVYGELPESVCLGDPAALKMVEMLRIEAETELGLGPQDTYRYLMGENGWNQAQAGVLDDILVFLVGGTGLSVEGGDPQLWPNDGLVSEYSAFATDIGTDVLPLRSTASYPLVHSIFVANMLGLDWQEGLTWNTQVLADVDAFLQSI